MKNKEFEMLEYTVSKAVGFDVDFATGAGEAFGFKVKTVFQVMPKEDAGTKHEKFWFWYAGTKPQWFKSPVEAAFEFVRNYRYWKTGE